MVQVGATNTSYVVLHEDKPPTAPDCCIIGRPFHAPPRDFTTLMPVQSSSPVGDVMVDWYAIYDKYVSRWKCEMRLIQQCRYLLN